MENYQQADGRIEIPEILRPYMRGLESVSYTHLDVYKRQSLDLLTPPPSEVEPVDTFALEQMARLVEARLRCV